MFAQLMADGLAEAELRKAQGGFDDLDGNGLLQGLPSPSTTSDNSWVFMESRGPHERGGPVPIGSECTFAGDRGVFLGGGGGGAVAAIAKVGTYFMPDEAAGDPGTFSVK